MNGAHRSKACVQNDLQFHDSPPLRLTSKLPLGRIDYRQLRLEQLTKKPKVFKPTPIGFKVSAIRAR